jgi:hypothetical protein
MKKCDIIEFKTQRPSAYILPAFDRNKAKQIGN